ncbi:MAG: MFS transporter [Chloroflexi bacterium]|nr:MAG: MFS transporter [Chloroflexota bacterium]
MAAISPGSTQGRGSRAAALRLVVLFGVVSLFADVVYEGGRSITGPYLALLGASGAAVGIVAGGGELLGYSLRLVSGRLADATRLYWPITIAGYVVQMLAVPALALVGSWPAAAALIILERVGKAMRNPPRDAMLAGASTEIGRGWAFGVHEALDQVGALVGPLLAAAILALQGSFALAFAILAIPAVITLATLAVARITYPDPGGVSARKADVRTEGLSSTFWLYIAAAGLVGAGFSDFSLMAFHFEKAGTLGDLVRLFALPPHWQNALPAIFYAVAMGTSGLGSLLFGRLFDRSGIVVLVPLTAVTALFAPLAFLGNGTTAFLGTILWGVGLGVHESVMQAAVAQVVPAGRLASAYGLFNLGFGVAWFAGSAVMGALYDLSIPALVVFSMIAELAAIPLFLRLRRHPALRGSPAA